MLKVKSFCPCVCSFCSVVCKIYFIPIKSSNVMNCNKSSIELKSFKMVGVSTNFHFLRHFVIACH